MYSGFRSNRKEKIENKCNRSEKRQRSDETFVAADSFLVSRRKNRNSVVAKLMKPFGGRWTYVVCAVDAHESRVASEFLIYAIFPKRTRRTVYCEWFHSELERRFFKVFDDRFLSLNFFFVFLLLNNLYSWFEFGNKDHERANLDIFLLLCNFYFIWRYVYIYIYSLINSIIPIPVEPLDLTKNK